MDKWEEVSVSDEFEQCCQEVASGEYVSCGDSLRKFLTMAILPFRWGPEGGKTLMALFRRLRSPSEMGYNRN